MQAIYVWALLVVMAAAAFAVVIVVWALLRGTPRQRRRAEIFAALLTLSAVGLYFVGLLLERSIDSWEPYLPAFPLLFVAFSVGAIHAIWRLAIR